MNEQLSNFLDLLIASIAKIGIVGSKAALILVVGIWFAYFISRKIKKILLKTINDEMLSSFISKISFVLVIIIIIIAALGTLGVQTTSIIAALGAAGLAIALALKDSLSNLASGIMLIIFRPFTKNDLVELDGYVGTIKDISIFHTYMRMPDGRMVIIPNTSVANTKIINYTSKSTGRSAINVLNSYEAVRRIDWLVGVSYGSDIDEVRNIIIESVEKTPNIDNGKEDSSKKIFVGVNELQASSIEFTVRAWVKDCDNFFATKCQMIENVKKALDSNGIEIPYSKLDVNILK